MIFALSVALAVAVAAVVYFSRARGASPAPDKAAPAQNPAAPVPARADPAVYPVMREQALTATRAKFGLPGTLDRLEPWGVVMDIAFQDGGSYTTIAFSDGSASIYLSSGGGFIGGHEHEAVNKAARRVVQLAARFQPQLTPTPVFPLPAAGMVTFYVLTDAGVLTGSAPEEELGMQRDPLWPLFHAAHEVITQYRLIDQGRRK